MSAFGASAAVAPAPDFSNDRFLVGTWSCAAETPDGAAREAATYEFTLDGRWLKLTYTVTPSSPGKPAHTTDAYEGWDARLKKWVYTSFSSDGTYGTSFSDGWKDGVKVYRPGPGEPDFRYTATKKSADLVVEEIEVPGPDHAWRRVFLNTCSRERARPAN